MTQFIIHVGPHKTGSSYLQAAFLAARPLLAERGVLYPPIWGETSHHELPERLLRIPDRTLERQFTELRQSGYPVVLISGEGLIDLPPAAIEYLRVLTRPRDQVRIVFYVRSWANLLLAHWKGAVREGDTRTLREYLLAWADAPAETGFLNFAPSLRRFTAQFGAAALDIVAYDSVLAEHGDLFRHFCTRFLGWPDAPAPDLPNVNVSLDAAETEIVRALQGIERARLGHPPGRERALALSDGYLGNLAKFPAPALRQALATHQGTVVLDERDAHLAGLHRALFDEFRDAIVAPQPKGALFPDRRAEIPYIQRDYLMAAGVVGELRQIHRELQEHGRS